MDVEDKANKNRDAMVKDLQALRIKYQKSMDDDSIIVGMLCFSTCLIYINMGDKSADHVLDHAKNEAKRTIKKLKEAIDNEKAN